MEGDSYISCIKINGVPILPPMMTKDIKEEMTYYKELAVAIEKKLAALCVLKQPGNSNKNSTEMISTKSKSKRFKERTYSLDSNIDCSKHDRVDHDESPTVTTVIDIPKKADSAIEKDISLKNSRSNTEENAQWDMNFDEENGSQMLSRSDSVTTSIDLNHLNGTPSINSETTETTPEMWKPQVPKTLNIVPLTLDSPNCAQEKYKNPETLETPKLVRQGSYVLDTPSPMLIAHMQTELANAHCTQQLEYVPTPTTNTVRRKEWNIAQAKIEWEHHKDFALDSKTSKKSPSDAHRIRKSISLQAKTNCPINTYSSTRSVDCIQAMLAKEYIGKSNRLNHDVKDSNVSNAGNEVNKNQRSNKKSSILNLPQRLGGSLENLNGDVSFPKHIDIEKVSTNGTDEESPKHNEMQDSTCKLKSSITSEKLLSVYKEIQEMHQKQMAELVDRQQKEQTLLQREFEKQQCLLLREIKKSFPEVSVSLISETMSSPVLNRLANGDTLEKETCTVRPHSQEPTSSDLQQEKKVQCPRDYENTKICPLDYIYAGMNFHAGKCTQSIKTIENNSAMNSNNLVATSVEKKESEMNVCQLNGTQTESSGRKCLNVSRQLFPLDSKTTHVPILDSSVYDTKHIRAGNIINAYARGYLVRRMMRTERVISLKNTYKEALHCMIKLHVDAPLNKSEFHFLHRLQLQCDAASMNIVELFGQTPAKRMQVITQDREIKRSRMERSTFARSYSFATQRTLARKKLKEMGDFQTPSLARTCSARSRCQTWTSDIKERLISPNVLHQSIKRSTSAGTMRKPWR